MKHVPDCPEGCVQALRSVTIIRSFIHHCFLRQPLGSPGPRLLSPSIPLLGQAKSLEERGSQKKTTCGQFCFYPAVAYTKAIKRVLPVILCALAMDYCREHLPVSPGPPTPPSIPLLGQAKSLEERGSQKKTICGQICFHPAAAYTKAIKRVLPVILCALAMDYCREHLPVSPGPPPLLASPSLAQQKA